MIVTKHFTEVYVSMVQRQNIKGVLIYLEGQGYHECETKICSNLIFKNGSRGEVRVLRRIQIEKKSNKILHFFSCTVE